MTCESLAVATIVAITTQSILIGIFAYTFATDIKKLKLMDDTLGKLYTDVLTQGRILKEEFTERMTTLGDNQDNLLTEIRDVDKSHTEAIEILAFTKADKPVKVSKQKPITSPSTQKKTAKKESK